MGKKILEKSKVTFMPEERIFKGIVILISLIIPHYKAFYFLNTIIKLNAT